MKKQPEIWSPWLHWLPFVVGLASACTCLYFVAGQWRTMAPDLRAVLLLGMVAGLLAVAHSIFAANDARELLSAKRREHILEEQLAISRRQTRQLNSHLEVLAAMREVTRILSDAVDLKQIAASVFEVLEPLLGTDEMAIVLRDDHQRLVVKALRRGGKTLSDEELADAPVDLALPAQAIEQQQTLRIVDGARGTFCVPLVADQAPLGVMTFQMPLEGSHQEKEARISEFESILADIAKHLALVVKTPSLHDRAIIDSLTGLFTRRHFDIRIDDLFRLSRRYAKPFSLILVDIDHFKAINDAHGHRAGDVALRETAALIMRSIRDCDGAFRYGGDEFAIILPETPGRQARITAERLRKVVRSNRIKVDGAGIALTISLGIAEYSPTLANHGELVALADRALYAAKQGGRDRALAAEDLAATNPPPAEAPAPSA